MTNEGHSHMNIVFENQAKLFATFLAGLVVAFGISATPSFAASEPEQVFIEGFPDVPLLAGLEEQAEDRVVFDAPSGTVAETVIRSNKAGKLVIDDYAKELVVFGWSCARQAMNMRCTREKSALVFLNKTPAKKTGVIILRLRPVG